MNNQTFLIIIDVFAELALTATYLGAAFAAFLILKQERKINWVSEFSPILKVVVFIIITQLLYSAGAFFVNNFIFFPRRLILGDSLVASVRCLGGLLALAGLVFGSYTLLKPKKDETHIDSGEK